MSDAAPGARPAEVLRASIRVRCELSQTALPGLLLIAAVVALTLQGQVPGSRLALWIVPLLSAVGWRAWLARRTLEQIDEADDAGLRRTDRQLLVSSLLNQTAAGSGMWSVSDWGVHEVALLMTLTVTLYAVGAMINLASDYRSFRASVPLVMGQVIAYWSLEGGNGWGIAATAALLTALMLGAVRRSSKTFADSVLMRFERAELLAEVEAERSRAVTALEQARSANRAKTMFLAAASHDLRQPLYATSLLADTLAYRASDDTTRNLVNSQRQAIGILRSLFDNLLDLSRFEAGGIVPNSVRLPLTEIIAPLAAQYSVFAAEKQLDWEVGVAPEWVEVDPSLLQRLIGNLLSNAVRYTDRGKIGLTARRIGERIEIQVSDTGPGIPAEHQARVFEEFAQLSNPQRQREAGLGLGLAIARRISDTIGADLRLASAAGSGCTFTLTVPAADREDHSTFDAAEPAPPAGLEIWVAEDDALVANALSQQFGAWGLRSRITSDAKAFRAAVIDGSHLPDGAILDDMLDGAESGFELAQWLSMHLPPERILIVTGNASEDRNRAIRDAGLQIMSKPVPARTLAEWMSSFETQPEKPASA